MRRSAVVYRNSLLNCCSFYVFWVELLHQNSSLVYRNVIEVVEEDNGPSGRGKAVENFEISSYPQLITERKREQLQL